MKPVRMVAATAAAALTAALAVAAAKFPVAPSEYQGVEKARAAQNLLTLARSQAGDGTWERIAVGRVLYLTGKKADGQQIFDEVLGGWPNQLGPQARAAGRTPDGPSLQQRRFPHPFQWPQSSSGCAPSAPPPLQPSTCGGRS